MPDLFHYARRTSCEVRIGDTPLGANHRVRVQSMATTSTNDVEASVAQARVLADAGAEYVRFTTQGSKEVENLGRIREALRAAGVNTPLVADVHFNPNVADAAACVTDKVRINPGNYVDTSVSGQLEARLLPLLQLCREHRTALRIGVNHGSLAAHIMEQYGDTPEGMVASCMEFLRVCHREQFSDVVLSIKASNPVVMVRTVRLLVATMGEEGMDYPLHLGVTEAGDGEDGRIKSALGIGALLSDGMGDTIRVSLSEPPENEIPVARELCNYITARAGHPIIPAREHPAFDYLHPARRETMAVGDIGGGQVPVVVSCHLQVRDELVFDPQCRPDYVYCSSAEIFADLKAREADLDYIVDHSAWQAAPHVWPAFSCVHLIELHHCSAERKFLFMPYMAFSDEVIACLRMHPEVVLISQSNHPNRLGEHRALAFELMHNGLKNPIITFQHYADKKLEDLQLHAAADMGALLLDGLSDGVMLFPAAKSEIPACALDATAYCILQAARLRITKTDYIACPGCGRTLYDLPATLARIKAATASIHERGLKIAVMGCIVNGPGEMADADYGYVGAGRGRISLYRKKECIEKNIPEEEAVERLLHLIESDDQRNLPG